MTCINQYRIIIVLMLLIILYLTYNNKKLYHKNWESKEQNQQIHKEAQKIIIQQQTACSQELDKIRNAEKQQDATPSYFQAHPNTSSMVELAPTFNKPEGGGKKRQIVNFNTSWCGHSRNLTPVWDQLTKHFNSNPNVEIIDMKCDDDANKEVCDAMQVRGFPTILRLDEDGKRTEYNGERSLEAFIAFAS